MIGQIKKVVIPVAGLGTRGLPFTKEVPKELLPIIDTPTIHFIVEEVLQAGIDQVIFVTSKGKSSLEDYFDPSPNLVAWLRRRGKEELADKIQRIGTLCEVISVRQKEPLGLGHAIYCARHIVNQESFAVCLGDEIFPNWGKNPPQENALGQLVSAANASKGSVVGVLEVPQSETSSYGIIEPSGPVKHGQPTKVIRTVEKPKPEQAPSQFAVVGRYVFESELFACLKDIKPGVGGELQLTDAMDKLCQQGKLSALLLEGLRYDIGSHLSYLKAQIDYAITRPELTEKVKGYLKGL